MLGIFAFIYVAFLILATGNLIKNQTGTKKEYALIVLSALSFLTGYWIES